MSDVTEQSARQPVLAIIAAAVLALSLFTPFLLVTIPVMATVGLTIASAFRKERPTWLPYVVGGSAILLLVFAHSHGPSSAIEPKEIKPSAIYADATWEYGETKDDMRGTITKNATLYSGTDLNLPAPYNGTSVVNIYVNNTSGIMLTVSDGQFQCDSNATVAIKIDNGPVLYYPCSMSDNGQTKYLFIENQVNLEKGQPVDPKDLLTSGKRMTVEANFFDAGTRQIMFNIAGFNPAKLK